MMNCLKFRACLLFAISLLLSNSYAADARLLCYLQNKNGNQPIELRETTTQLKNGIFQDVVTYSGQTVKIFTPNDKYTANPTYLYPHIWNICSGIERGNHWVRGYAVVGPDGRPTDIGYPKETFSSLVTTDMFRQQRSSELLKKLTIKAALVTRDNGAESSMTDKDFFADYTEDTFRNTYIVAAGFGERLSGIVEPLNMQHPSREEVKRRLTAHLYGELNHKMANSAKASQAAASFIISYTQPIGNLLAIASNASFYISKLGEPSEKQQTFEITQSKNYKDKNMLAIRATVIVKYPGYTSATGQSIISPFEIKYTIPFHINYANYRNNDYQQNFPVSVLPGLFEKLELNTTDSTLKDALWGAWLDGKTVTIPRTVPLPWKLESIYDSSQD